MIPKTDSTEHPSGYYCDYCGAWMPTPHATLRGIDFAASLLELGLIDGTALHQCLECVPIPKKCKASGYITNAFPIHDWSIKEITDHGDKQAPEAAIKAIRAFAQVVESTIALRGVRLFFFEERALLIAFLKSDAMKAELL